MTHTNPENQPLFATLTIDKPLVESKTTFQVKAGKILRDTIKDTLIKPGMAYVILINGQVVDQNVIIQPGDQIRCLPQITGGMT